jgi:ankyrin repeat protein
MGAAQRADAHTIEILLLAGADIEASSDDGLTPLMFAASAGNSETVDALLRAGADVRAADPVRGWNALFWAVPADEAPDAWRSLTAAYGDVSRMPATPTGMTLLMRKAAQADRAAIEFLLDAGADPLAVDEHGRTADQYADPRAAELVYQAVLARLRP